MKTGAERLDEHIDFIYSLLPEINTVQGYLFYILTAFLISLFYGWLTTPAVIKIKDDYERSQTNLRQSTKMRQENRDRE